MALRFAFAFGEKQGVGERADEPFVQLVLLIPLVETLSVPFLMTIGPEAPFDEHKERDLVSWNMARKASDMEYAIDRTNEGIHSNVSA